jgi:phosphate transport system substrate-binding protein
MGKWSIVMKKLLLAAILGCLAPWTVSAAEVQIDSEIPTYSPVEGISGTLKSIGSDSMNNLMSLWAEGFRRIYPNVTIEVEGKGSATAPPALISGTADFGPMSREMKSGEIDEFEKKYGYKPLALPTSIDVLAVYVHRDNPIAKLALPQVDAIFSQTRKLGYDSDIRTWGQLGLTGEWANQPISMYGRNSASGTYGFFKEHALGKGDYKNTVKEQPGSSSVVQGVASDKYAIGYSGIGYKTADVRAVPLSTELNGTPVAAEAEFAYSGEYPMTRVLTVYVNHKPGTALPPVKREFIRYVFSQQGQQDVLKDGYLPATGFMVRKTLESLGLAGAQ